MNTPITEENWTDTNGNPAGGIAYGNGFTISWQNGPLGRHAIGCVPVDSQQLLGRWMCAPDCTRRAPNGAFVEDIIEAVRSRLEFYQTSKFHCEENRIALEHLACVADVLDSRTKTREARAVEGTHAK